MIELETKIKAWAVRAEKTVQITHDGGKFTVFAGDWLVDGEYGLLTTLSDEALRKEFTVTSESSGDSEQENRLLKALETGNY